MLTEGIISSLAVRAFHTWHQRNPRHPVPFLQRGNTFSHLRNRAGELVPQHIVEEMAGVTVHPWYIRAADAGVFYLDLHLPLPRPGGLNLFKTDIILCVYYSCFHSCLTVPFLIFYNFMIAKDPCQKQSNVFHIYVQDFLPQPIPPAHTQTSVSRPPSPSASRTVPACP